MRLYFYELKNLFKTKDLMFWTMAFPLILGTLFFVTFGNAKLDSNFDNIPIAVMEKDGESQQIFETVLHQVAISGDREEIGLEQEKGTTKEEKTPELDGGIKELEAPYFGDEGIFDIPKKEISKEDALFVNYDLTEKEAKKALNKEDIAAIIYVNAADDITMEVKKSSINASIAECFVNQYLAQYDQFMTVLKEHPENLKTMIENMTNEAKDSAITIQDQSENTDDYNPFINYFYALIAMTCMYGSMFSQKSIQELQADQSALGARRNVAPTNKSLLLMTDVLAAMTIQFAEVCIALFYLIQILGVNFGDNIAYILLAAFAGCFMGNSLGMFVGTVFKCSADAKGGIITCVSLVCCFFSGLMLSDMLHIVELHAPWFNRINPAALLANAFYALSIYDTMQQYYQNVITLFAIGLVMDIVSITIIRRKRYASI